MAYMAKVPSGKTAANWDGSGTVWFKIYEQGPTGFGTQALVWPSNGMFLVLCIATRFPNSVAHGRFLKRLVPRSLYYTVLIFSIR